MNNTKHNAALLLAEIGKLLAAEHAEASVTVAETKPNFAAPAPAPDRAVPAACDVVFTGVGDCGRAARPRSPRRPVRAGGLPVP